MLLIYLTFLSAFLLSGIAAYYSVLGLALIFTGAFWPVVFMGSSLEFAKLVTASWLYRNWKKAPILLKYYLTSAVVILMLITSMGIFGFLAKSHIDSTLTSGNNTAELKTLTTQERIAKERLDYLLKRAGDPETASARIDKQIQDTQKELATINQRKLPLLKEETKLAADVGPIKYVADMFFGDGDGALDKAVRLVIIIIMLVFDPLAVLLLIAGNMSLRELEKDESQKKPIGIKIPIFTDKKVPPNEGGTITVEKDNVTTIQTPAEVVTEENKTKQEKRITIDETTRDSIPEIKKTHEVVEEHHAPGVFTQTHVPLTNYDYDAELAFKKKKDVDGGNF